MGSLFKEKKLLITLILDVVLTLGIPFIIYAICVSNGVHNFPYQYFFAMFGIVNALLAYLVGDIILVSYKKKNGIVTSSIPEEVILESKKWRYPFIISLIIDMLVFVVFVIIFYATGHWPLL